MRTGSLGGVPAAHGDDVYQHRKSSYRSEKRCIAEYVAFWLRTHWADSAISVDGGTTNEQIVATVCRDAKLGRRTVGKIITNNLMALRTIGDSINEGMHPAAEATGGTLRPTRWTLLGKGAVETLEHALFSVAIVGANGFFVPHLATRTTTEQQVKLKMIERAVHVVFPIDAYKWGKAVGSSFANLHQLAQEAGKFLYLVTAYPMQENNEDINSFNRRLDTFLKTAAELVRTWKQKYGDAAVTVVFSKVNLPDDLTLAPTPEPKACICEDVSPEVDFFKEFVAQISWKDARKSGLAIAFELRGPRALSSSE